MWLAKKFRFYLLKKI